MLPPPLDCGYSDTQLHTYVRVSVCGRIDGPKEPGPPSNNWGRLMHVQATADFQTIALPLVISRCGNLVQLQASASVSAYHRCQLAPVSNRIIRVVPLSPLLKHPYYLFNVGPVGL